MQFNSYIFLLLFLPVTLIGYFTLNRFEKYKAGMLFLLAANFVFYAYANIWFLPVLLASIIINFLLSKKAAGNKAVLILSVIINISALGVFKYLNFVMDTAKSLFSINWTDINIILPLGISFFTFQQIAYCVDSYRGETKAYGFIEYASFVSFFPKIMQGPIVTHNELLPQFSDAERKKFNFENAAKGITVFAVGLAKKVLLADVLATAVDFGYGNVGALNASTALIAVLGYTLQIYFDFSGYCDMAIGIGKIMNIDLPVNFDSPYRSLSILEFWKRWHITLTKFFTKYLYIPLGGNRKGAIRTYVNVMIVFLISGLWHGASWTFVLWGGLHGLASVLNRLFRTPYEKIPKAIRFLLTFVFINLSWVFFRADSFSDAITVIKALFSFDFGSIASGFVTPFVFVELDAVFRILLGRSLGSYGLYLIITFFIISLLIVFWKKNALNSVENLKPRVSTMVFAGVLLLWCIISFSNISTFIYNGF